MGSSSGELNELIFKRASWAQLQVSSLGSSSGELHGLIFSLSSSELNGLIFRRASWAQLQVSSLGSSSGELHGLIFRLWEGHQSNVSHKRLASAHALYIQMHKLMVLCSNGQLIHSRITADRVSSTEGPLSLVFLKPEEALPSTADIYFSTLRSEVAYICVAYRR
ncbi:hypothetical protein J6590_054223 [Homalodisca vitripennis]|nr:hypothetical protein J6590_054223 [Homalodisca vitripennis]